MSEENNKGKTENQETEQKVENQTDILKEFEDDVSKIEKEFDQINVEDVKNSDLVSKMTNNLMSPDLSQEEMTNNLKTISYAYAIMDEDSDAKYAEYIENIRVKEKEEFEKLEALKEKTEAQNMRMAELSQAASLEPFEFFAVNLFNKDKIEGFKKENPESLKIFEGVDKKVADKTLELEDKYAKDNPQATKKDFEAMGALDTVLDTLDNPKLKSAFKIGKMIAMPHTIPMVLASKAVGGLICAGLKTETGQNLIGKMKDSWENKFGPINPEPNPRMKKAIGAALFIGGIASLCVGLDLDDVKDTFSNTLDAVKDGLENIDYEEVLKDSVNAVGNGLDQAERFAYDNALAAKKGLAEGLDTVRDAVNNSDELFDDLVDSTIKSAKDMESAIGDAIENADQSLDEMENYVDQKMADIRDALGNENYNPGEGNTYAASSGQNINATVGGDTDTLMAGSGSDVTDIDGDVTNLDAEVDSIKLDSEIKSNLHISGDKSSITGTVTLNGQEIDVEKLTPELQDKLFLSADENQEIKEMGRYRGSKGRIEDLINKTAFRSDELNDFRDHFNENPDDLSKLLSGGDLNDAEEIANSNVIDSPDVESPTIDAETQRANYNMAKAESGAGTATGDTDVLSAAENDAVEINMPDSFTIKSGDNLEKLVADAMPEGTKYEDIQEMTRKIAEHNGLEDADKIFPGQEIKIPELSTLDGMELKDFKIDGAEDLFALDKVPYGSQLTPDEYKDQMGSVLKDMYPDEPDRVNEMMAYVNGKMSGLDPNQPIPSGTDIGLSDEHIDILRDKTYQMADEQESMYHSLNDDGTDPDIPTQESPYHGFNDDGTPIDDEPEVQAAKVEDPKVEEPKVEEPKAQSPQGATDTDSLSADDDVAVASVDDVEPVKLGDEIKANFSVSQLTDPPTMNGTVTLNGQEIDVNNLTPKLQDKLFVSMEEKNSLDWNTSFERDMAAIDFGNEEMMEFREHFENNPNDLSKLLSGGDLNDVEELAAANDFDTPQYQTEDLGRANFDSGDMSDMDDIDTPDEDIPEYKNENSGRNHFEDISDEEKAELLAENDFDTPQYQTEDLGRANFDSGDMSDMDDIDTPDEDIPEYKNENSGRNHFEDISDEEKAELLAENDFDTPQYQTEDLGRANFDSGDMSDMDDIDTPDEDVPEYKNENSGRNHFEDISDEEKAELLAENDFDTPQYQTEDLGRANFDSGDMSDVDDFDPETDPEYMNPTNQKGNIETPEEAAALMAETDFDTPQSETPDLGRANFADATDFEEVEEPEPMSMENDFGEPDDVVPEKETFVPEPETISPDDIAEGDLPPAIQAVYDKTPGFDSDSTNMNFKAVNGEVEYLRFNNVAINPDNIPDDLKELMVSDNPNLNLLEEQEAIEKYLENNPLEFKSMMLGVPPEKLDEMRAMAEDMKAPEIASLSADENSLNDLSNDINNDLDNVNKNDGIKSKNNGLKMS